MPINRICSTKLKGKKRETLKSTNETGAPYVLWIFSFKNPGNLIEDANNVSKSQNNFSLYRTKTIYMYTDLENT